MDDDPLYNAMIIALVIGIIIVIITLIFMRPEPEYFTELYFSDHKSLPEYISPEEEYRFTITIHNHEQGEKTYPVKVTAELEDNKTIEIDALDVKIGRDLLEEVTITYILPDFYRAKIQTTVQDKEIHFWVYNRDAGVIYPDTFASDECLEEIEIFAVDSFVIRAKATADPNMKVRIDGEEIYATVVNNTEYTDFHIEHALKANILDIVFDNDGRDPETGVDRNLFIEKITIGSKTLYPGDGILDTGKGAAAFDCKDIKDRSELKWNAALRFKFKTK